MKLSLGRMSLKENVAFVLVVTLLFQDVAPMSIEMPNETTVATITPSVASGSEEDALEKNNILDKYKPEVDESKLDFRKVSLTDLDDSLDDIEAILPDEEELDSLQDNRTGSPLTESATTSKEGMTENKILTSLDPNELRKNVGPFSSFVKTAAEKNDKTGESEADAINEDDFMFSDLPQIFEPLIKAFSGSPTAEPPPPEDFFSWFPSLKEILEPSKEDHGVAEPTGSPGSTITQPENSVLPTFSEPSLQIAPALTSAQPAESESLPYPSRLEELSSSVVPTLPEPPLTSETSRSGVPDPEERND